ncbi:hypothetical protein [Rhizobium sp. BK650]|nr:hypothetical protein [Rhizobium sp. BK650]
MSISLVSLREAKQAGIVIVPRDQYRAQLYSKAELKLLSFGMPD